ncbi:retrovirus-related pol polyprotein from transposon TNT 1-94, partial [Tanacetum coccineum]
RIRHGSVLGKGKRAHKQLQGIFHQASAAERKQKGGRPKQDCIYKLRASKDVEGEDVKMDIDEMETINIELEHSVAKLLSENENLNLNDQLQEKVFAIAALKNEKRKLKGKSIIDNAVSKPFVVTIASGMFMINLEPLAPKVLKNKDAHIDYIKHTRENADILQELVENARALSPLDSNLDSALAVTPLNKDRKVRFVDPIISSSNVPKQTNSLKSQDSNKPLLHSTGVKCSTSASGSKPSNNTKNDRISQSSSSNKTNKVKDQSRSIKSRKNKKNRVYKTECNAHVMQSMLDANSISEPINNALVKHYVRNAKFESICASCNKCLFDANHDKCFIDYVNDVNVRSKSKSNKKKMRKVWKPIGKVVQIVLWYLDSGCSKHMTGNCSQLINFASKFLGTVRYRNDHIAKIMGYGDYQMGNVTISMVYYVEGLGHNLFFVGQFCDSDLEVSFYKHTCFVRDLEGVDLYILSLENLMLSSPICLLSKASKTKSWLWHRRLSHLNFDYINSLAKQETFPQTQTEDSIQEKLFLLHMDLCGPMRVQSINGRKYILVIVDDFSRFTWVKFLRSKDEVPEFTLRTYYEEVGISHQTSVARTPQHNGVVERQNHTLVEASRTILIFSKALLFLWAEAITAACYTQNRSLIRKHHNKTPYELLHDRKPDLSYLHVFGALCYPTNDGEDLGKLRPKADIRLFVAMASEQFISGLGPKLLSPGKISSGLVQNISSSTPYVPPIKDDWEILFQPMFDEYLNPPPSVDLQAPTFITPEPVVSTGTPSSTTIDQDAPLIERFVNPFYININI